MRPAVQLAKALLQAVQMRQLQGCPLMKQHRLVVTAPMVQWQLCRRGKGYWDQTQVAQMGKKCGRGMHIDHPQLISGLDEVRFNMQLLKGDELHCIFHISMW